MPKVSLRLRDPEKCEVVSIDAFADLMLLHVAARHILGAMQTIANLSPELRLPSPLIGLYRPEVRLPESC